MGKPIQIMAGDRLLGLIRAGEPSPLAERVEREFMGTWYADIYTLQNRDVFIFTEEKTLYSIFACGKGIASEDAFVSFFGDAMKRSVIVEMPILEKIDDWKPGLRLFPSDDTRTRRAQAAHMKMAIEMAAIGVDISECNDEPIPEADGLIPRSMYRAEIWRLFPELMPAFHPDQFN